MAYWELGYLPSWEAPELASQHIQIPKKKKKFFFSMQDPRSVLLLKNALLHIWLDFLPINGAKVANLRTYLYSPFRIDRAR